MELGGDVRLWAGRDGGRRRPAWGLLLGGWGGSPAPVGCSCCMGPCGQAGRTEMTWGNPSLWGLLVGHRDRGEGSGPGAPTGFPKRETAEGGTPRRRKAVRAGTPGDGAGDGRDTASTEEGQGFWGPRGAFLRLRQHRAEQRPRALGVQPHGTPCLTLCHGDTGLSGGPAGLTIPEGRCQSPVRGDRGVTSHAGWLRLSPSQCCQGQPPCPHSPGTSRRVQGTSTYSAS